MPQDELFEGPTQWTGVQIEAKEVVTPSGRRWDLTLRRQGRDGVWRSVWQGSWEGVMLDFSQTFASEAMAAFMFGESRDLARAAAGVHVMARRHARAHDRM